MRVAICEFKHEANTFAPTRMTLDDFRAWHFWEGDEVIEGSRDTNVEVAGFIDELEAAGIEPIPTLATFALSGGPLTSETYATIRDRLLARLSAAGPLDGVLLALHGAMVTVDDDDPDGATIAAVRSLLGPEMPIFVSMDLHANVTRRCVENADVIVGFRTFPHTDLRETGSRTANLLIRRLRGEIRPRMRFVKLPMVTPGTGQTQPGPFQRLMDAARTAEGDGVLSTSVFVVQAWLDINEMGSATIAITDGDPDLARKTACRLADLAWSERHALMETELIPADEAIRRALANPAGPVVLSDLADGTGAGSPGDATAVIAALLAVDPPKTAFVCVRDPEVAGAAAAAGLGSEMDIMVGGKIDVIYNQPVRFQGKVEFAGPASFRFGGAGYTGVAMEMGECAVLRHNNVHLLVVSNAVFTIDPAMYRAVGLEPADAQIVVVKSHLQFRAGYAGLATEIILLDTPGVSSDRLESLHFRRVSRPLFPLDPDAVFSCERVPH